VSTFNIHTTKLRITQHQNANTRLAPGDMVSVDPEAIRFLQAESAQEPREVHKESTTTKDEDEKLSNSDTSAKPPNSTKTEDRDLKLTPLNLPPYSSPFIFIPAYIEPSFTTCSAIYVRHPTARPGYSEIPTPYDADGEVIRLAWEWYAKVRPRMRSKSQLARMPENRR